MAGAETIASDPLDDEARRLAFLVYVRAEQNVTAARFFENIHFLVGSIGAGLAVAAGGTAFAGETTVAGVAAITSAVLTGYLTVHRPEERTASHWRAARDFGKLYNDMVFVFEVMRREHPEQLHDFMSRATAIEDASFPVAERLCRRAEEGISESRAWMAPAGRDFPSWKAELGRRRPRWRRRHRPPLEEQH